MKILKKVSNTVLKLPTQQNSRGKTRDKNAVSTDTRLPPMVLKTLSVAMASAFIASMAQVAQADTQARMIGDLEIYKAPEQGSANLMLMLDTSGSMGYFEPSKKCNTIYTYSGNKYEQFNVVVKKDDGTVGEKVPYVVRGCYVFSQYQDARYDRMSRLKLALLPIFADPAQYLGSNYGNYKMGFGSFVNNRTGKIVKEAAELDYVHRLNLVKQLANLKTGGGTPSASAYAEAGAYMLGTTTATDGEVVYKVKGKTERTWYKGYGYQYDYKVCNANNSSESNLGNIKVQACTSYSANGRSRWWGDFPYSRVTVRFIEDNFGFNGSLLGKVDRYYTIGGARYFLEQVSGPSKYSGFPYSSDDTKVKPELKIYDTPLTTGGSQCSGNGIYFLTDGFPNTSTDPISSSLMNMSLETSNLTVNTGGVCSPIEIQDGSSYLTDQNTNSGSRSGWECMGAYAKLLNSNKHVKKSPILTAAVGFGSSFSTLRKTSRTVYDEDGKPVIDPETNQPKKIIVNDCSSARNQDSKNLCYLGEKTYGFGEGGFTATSTPEGVRDSLVKFLEDLNGDIGSTPTGIIVVPDDPYNASSQQAIAFYPTVDAKAFDANVIWSGNMKKYALNNGTLYGKGDKKLFLDITGALDAKVQDLWSDKDYKANGVSVNSAVTSGGFYAHLSSPKDGITSLRTLYLEDWNNITDKKPVLRKLGVNASGRVTLDGSTIGGSNNFVDTDTYTDENVKALLGFLGFTNIDASGAIKDLTLTVANNAPESIRVLGASMHSNPALVSYYASLDEDGRVTDERDEYVLFGSMDGALHLADIDDDGSSDGGKEVFAFIPREIIKNQPKALIAGNTHGAIGIPKMGMDAPWLVTADYTYDLDNNQVRVDKSESGINAYGGMRMGGIGFYGLNLNDKTNPELLFTLAPEYDGDGKPTGDFARMGQIWAKPTKAKIRLTNSDTDTGTEVLIFGGGYDMCYEYEDYQVGLKNTVDSNGKKKYSFPASCENKTTADGNAVYVVNAGTGELIWSASKDSATTTNPNMVNSIVAGITVLDRNDDGYMDHLYFADLGGQVFRADFKNAGFKDADGNIELSFSNKRVIRILNNAHSGTKYAHRFYERPVVSFYRNSITKRLFAMVNIISGDRSSPLSKMRENNKYADRLYGIMDIDVAKANSILFAEEFDNDGTGRTIHNIGDGQLYELPKDGAGDDGNFSATEKETIITKLKAGKKKGWYYPLIRFDGFNKVKYTKGMGKSEVIGGFLFTSTYNPDMSYGEGAGCSAEIVGGSERQLYCLPYGICTDEKSKNGTGGFIRAGKGIQELTLGPRSSEFSNQRLLIGTRSIEERKDNRIDFGEQALEGGLYDEQTKVADPLITNVGADGTAPLYIFNERYTFNPTTWYESSDND